MERKIAHYDGYELSYLTAGSGLLTLVLLHGFPETSNIFLKQIAYLKEYANIIVPDLPGAGDSAYNPQLTTVEDFARCVHHVVEVENARNVVIAGHSMGGYIALAYEELYPNELVGFGLIHSTAYPDSDAKIEMRTKSIEIMAEYGAVSFVQKSIPGLVSDNFKQNNPAVIAQLISDASEFKTEALQLFYKIMLLRPDRSQHLKTSKPILFVVGKKDVTVPFSDLQAQFVLPPIAMVEIFEDVAHLSMEESPNQLNEVLQKYLELAASFLPTV